MNKFNDRPDYKDALLTIIEKFDYLRVLIQENSTDEQMEVYLLLEKYLGYLNEHLPEAKIKDETVSILFSETMKRFTFKEKFQSALNAKGYIINDNR